jgi:hypothetical protein
MTRSRTLETVTAAAIALWVIVGAGLLYGIWQTVAKVTALFS